MENQVNSDLLGRITYDHQIMGGKAIIRGLRISVEQVLKALASGVTTEDILTDYPELEKEDMLAVFLYKGKLRIRKIH